MKLKSIQGLFFLSFLTDLNIIKIYSLIEKYEDLNDLQNGENLSDDFLSNILEKSNLSFEKTVFNNISIIPYYDEYYPKKLNILKDKPPLLFIKGNYDSKRILINVVGTRLNSEYGSKLTKKVVNLLLDNNFGITSGLALGIDTIAHKTVMEREGAYTISILATSLDTIYPKENYGLANEILNNYGALISEVPIDISLGKRRFVQRNRIQAALSEITIPIELTRTSGTMHTVEFTFKQNKKVIFIKPLNNIQYIENFNDVIDYLSKKQNKQNMIIVANSQELLDAIYEDTKKDTLNQVQQIFDF
jgi:DNA processing protein